MLLRFVLKANARARKFGLDAYTFNMSKRRKHLRVDMRALEEGQPLRLSPPLRQLDPFR
jgi:hypothetical protein